MFVRLTIADVKEGEINNALEYVKNTVIPSYDGLPGLLGLAACETNDGRFMAWSTWANEGAKEASIDKFNQALAGAAEMLDGQPDVTEGSMVAGQQYIAVSKDGGDGFFARFVLGGGTQEGKTYDDVAEFMTNTVYPAYENVEGIYGAGACKVAEDKGASTSGLIKALQVAHQMLLHQLFQKRLKILFQNHHKKLLANVIFGEIT